jgi:hypothetical protein
MIMRFIVAEAAAGCENPTIERCASDHLRNASMSLERAVRSIRFSAEIQKTEKGEKPN